MQVIIRKASAFGFVGTPTDDGERSAIVADMNANGADLPSDDWPLFLQGTEQLDEALDALGVASIHGRDGLLGVPLDVDAWTFRRLCGYAAG